MSGGFRNGRIASRPGSRWIAWAAPLALALFLASAAGSSEPARAAGGVPSRSFTVPTPAAPGPAEFNRAYVRAHGNKRARNVLVLMPGTFGGAGDFTLAARELARRNRNLQVWALDRREQALEDTSMFRRALNGKATLQEAYDYYLGWLTGTYKGDHVEFLKTKTMTWAREWGMKTVLRDTRAVVRRARKAGRRVILGGHSVGASLAISYAAWDFNGRPGFRDLDGLVLIDGGLMGSFDPYNLPQAKDAMAAMEENGPFSDLIGIGIPELSGIFAEIGALYARFDPTGPATTLQGFPLLPDYLNPPVPTTNRGLFGYDFDRDTSPDFLSSLHVNAGRLGTGPPPVDWVDGGITPIRNLALTFAQEPANAVDWFFPTRITIDANGADQMRMNPVARHLGLRLFHTRKVNLPFYVIQTDDTGGDVLKGARNWLRRTKTPRRQAVLVNRDPLMSHLDPLVAAPRRNAFIKTVGPFLRKAFATRGNRRGR
ncbi:MAG: alpha/beta fold hydrolase [Actinomycetota bacterium]|nr:alpha/beta fold hydrolase [Actinomycetota bacterium]